MLRSLLFICVSLSIGSQLSAQIVNVERLRKFIGDRHFAIESGLNFSYDNNNGQYVYRFIPSAAVLYKFKDKGGQLNNKFLLNGNYKLIRTENQDFKNNWFVHLRFNKEFTSVFRMVRVSSSTCRILRGVRFFVLGSHGRVCFVVKTNRDWCQRT